MIRLEFSVDLRYEIAAGPADSVFNIHAARTPSQSVAREVLHFNRETESSLHEDWHNGMRWLRLCATPGLLAVHYEATVDIEHYMELPARIAEVPVNRLPMDVMSYIYPSRYCQSDRLSKLALREFGHLRPGYGRAQVIQDWVKQHIIFMVGSSNCSTSALDTLVEPVGVCRDFAHLLIALCRALNIPARFVTGIDYGADPGLGPTDFHAYVEAYLGDRWYLFDPSGISPPMGLVRIGTGRDAADVSFATVFGAVKPTMPLVHIEAIDNPDNGFILPQYSSQAVSSHAPAPV